MIAEVEVEVVPIFLRRLGRFEALSAVDERAILELEIDVKHAPGGRRVVRAGSPSDGILILLRGYTCHYTEVHDGSRQIISYGLPGDLIGLSGLFGQASDYCVQSVGAIAYGCIGASRLARLCFERPTIGRALWKDSLRQAAMTRELAVQLGRTRATARLAYFLSDFLARARDAGLAEKDSYSLPFTQEEIGDALGLTSIHVNRTFKALEERGLIKRQNRFVVVPSPAALLHCAESDTFAARWSKEQSAS